MPSTEPVPSPSSSAPDGETGGAPSVPAEPEPAVWHAAISTSISGDQLDSEYAAWVSKYVQDCAGTDSAVVVKDGGQVVSEGIAYGMLLAVGQDDQMLFDKLWRYYEDHLDENGLMNWSMEVCAAAGDNDANAAADADLDATMALVQASSRWGGDYLASAETLAQSILAFETVSCADRLVIKPGDTWGGCEDKSGQTRINPSYFAPGYYRVFAARFEAQKDQWQALLDGTYELHAIYQQRLDGLFPDWSDADGADWYDSTYGYDACRTPWRVAVDFAWSGDDRARTTLEATAARVTKEGGIPAGTYPNNSAFQGAFALSFITDQQSFDSMTEAWMNAGGDDTPYFQATLRLLYLQVALGRFPSTL
jgi:endo-1,4-beta-D-glucanase Y